MAQFVNSPSEISKFSDLSGRRSASSGIAAANNFGGRPLFFTVTGEDFARSIRASLHKTNSVAEQIRAAEISLLR